MGTRYFSKLHARRTVRRNVYEELEKINRIHAPAVGEILVRRNFHPLVEGKEGRNVGKMRELPLKNWMPREKDRRIFSVFLNPLSLSFPRITFKLYRPIT